MEELVKHYQKNLEEGFKSKNIFTGIITLVWITLKFTLIMLGFILSFGVYTYGVSKNSKVITAVDKTGIVNVFSQETQKRMIDSVVDDAEKVKNINKVDL